MSIEDVDWRYVIFPVVFVASALAISQFIGIIDGTEFTEEVASEVTPKVLQEVASQEDANPDLTAIRNNEAQLERVGIYVDRSLSMKPYLTDRQDSDFHRLLNQLGNFVDSETEFYGFGFKHGEGESQSVEETSPLTLKQASAYTYANNDYGDLLGRFSKGETTNLVVTDGVQSDPESKAQLGGVLEAIDNWVRSGGTFATFFYRTNYRGQYYSDLPGEEPVYECKNRPVTTFVLGRSPSAVSNLVERFGTDFQPDHLVRLGGNPLPMSPAARKIAGAERERGERVLQSLEEYVLADYNQVFEIEIAPASAGPNDFVPLQLQMEASRSDYPWRALEKEQIRTFLQHLEPEIRAYEVRRSEMERINSARSQTRNASLIASAEDDTSGGNPLVQRVSIQTQEVPSPTIRIENDTVQARFEIPARKPEATLKTPFYALLTRFQVRPRAARMLIPDSYSTKNDLKSENCSKIYNLQQLVGTIMRRNYAPAQALLLAEWH